MPVRAKRIYDPPSAEDGVRVLTTNYWPRGISRERAGEYVRVLAPSRPLLRAYKDGAIGWDEYRSRYLEEMTADAARKEIARLAEIARTGVVTVMCVCPDERRCHRSLLKELIERAMEAQT